MQHHLLIISNLFSMLANINIKQKKQQNQAKKGHIFLSAMYT
jgi:hypothetical protein